MNAARHDLKDRLEAVRARVATAAGRSGRGADEVRLVGVVKTVAAAVVSEAVALGLGDLGENRVQDAEGRIRAVGRAGARWHMIGHLQRNKAGRAVALFDRVHGVDGPEIAAALSRHAGVAGRKLPVLIEVNLGGEPTQFGVAPDALEGLVAAIATLPGLGLDGLMTVGPPVSHAEDARGRFARLRELRDRAARATGERLPELSMGMSGDFEVAIEEGSTMVRIGTALFGSRT